MPYSEYAKSGRPVRLNPRLNGGYPSFAPPALRDIKSSGYGLVRPNRSAQLQMRPLRREKLPPRAISTDSSQQSRRASRISQEAEQGPPIAQPREQCSPSPLNQPEVSAEECEEEEEEEPAAPEEAEGSAPVRRSAVRKGKLLFGPCLDVEGMSVPEEVQHAPGLSFHCDGNCRVLEFLLGMHGFRKSRKDPNWSLWWTSGGTIRASMLQSLLPHQKVNHFPRSSEISRKDRMSENIYRMQQQHGHKSFDLVPKTFVLPRQHDLFVEEFNADSSALWIVKPIASSCGRGIFVTNKLSEIPEQEHLVVSRYIANPLLIDGHKFDLRIYVCVTSFDPLRIYVYEEGLVRFATEKYEMSKENLKNSCVHLTNYSINKHSDKFDDDEEDASGHKWSLSAFRAHLQSCGVDDKLLFDRINDMVVRSLLSVEPSVRSACAMYQNHHSCCFELLGFDVMVEDNLRPWLIEVNLGPSLSCPAPLDRQIKSQLISDLLTTVGLSARPPHIQKKKSKKTPKRPNPALDENRYSYVGEQTSFSQTLMMDISPDDRRVIKDVQAEMERAATTRFQCVFPTQHSVSYAPYFDGPRPLNALLARLLWTQVGMDVTSAKAKVIAKNSLVPFWKEGSPKGLRLRNASPMKEKERDSFKPEDSTLSRRLSGLTRRGIGKSAIGFSPVLSRFSLPSAKEVKEMKSGRKSGSADRLPDLPRPHSHSHEMAL